MLANLVKQVCRVYFWKDGGIHLIQEEEKEEKIPPTAIQDGEFKMAEDPGDLFVRTLSQHAKAKGVAHRWPPVEKAVGLHHLSQALGKTHGDLLPSFYWAAGQNVQNQHLLSRHYSKKQRDQITNFNHLKLPISHKLNIKSVLQNLMENFEITQLTEISMVRSKFRDFHRGWEIRQDSSAAKESAVSLPTRRPKSKYQHRPMSTNTQIFSRIFWLRKLDNDVNKYAQQWWPLTIHRKFSPGLAPPRVIWPCHEKPITAENYRNHQGRRNSDSESNFTDSFTRALNFTKKCVPKIDEDRIQKIRQIILFRATTAPLTCNSQQETNHLSEFNFTKKSCEHVHHVANIISNFTKKCVPTISHQIKIDATLSDLTRFFIFINAMKRASQQTTTEENKVEVLPIIKSIFVFTRKMVLSESLSNVLCSYIIMSANGKSVQQQHKFTNGNFIFTEKMEAKRPSEAAGKPKPEMNANVEYPVVARKNSSFKWSQSASAPFSHLFGA